MNDIREQFLERLTREFFHKKGEGFVLKGGAALRTLFGEQRLTKAIDLDFTNPKRTADSLHKTVHSAIQAAARGLPLRDMQISAPGKADSSPRWKINFADDAGQPCHVEVEVSRDARRAVPGRVKQVLYTPAAAKGIAKFWVDIYDEPALIATKISALLGREVPRDVYDLDLLIGSATPASELVAWAVEHADLGSADPVATLWAHLDGLTWSRFESELHDTPPSFVAERVDETEWLAMKLRVGEYVQQLLKELPS